MFSRHPQNTTRTVVQRRAVIFVSSGVDVTEDATQRVSISGSAHGRKGHRLRLVLHVVEVALLKMVRHAGEIGETPRQHRAESSAEAPHLSENKEKR